MGLIAGVGDFGLTELRDETLQYRNEAEVILDTVENLDNIGILNASTGVATIETGTVTLTATPPIGWLNGQGLNITTAGNISFSGINFSSGQLFNNGDKLIKLGTQFYGIFYSQNIFAKVQAWSSNVYQIGSQVNYNGEDWTNPSSIAQVTDVPSVSSVWIPRLSKYSPTIIVGKQKYDKSLNIVGFINNDFDLVTTGSQAVISKTSGLIPVTEGLYYALSGVTFASGVNNVQYCDINGTKLTGTSGDTLTNLVPYFLAPTGCKFVRICPKFNGGTDYSDTMLLEIGTVPTTYEAYKQKYSRIGGNAVLSTELIAESDSSKSFTYEGVLTDFNKLKGVVKDKIGVKNTEYQSAPTNTQATGEIFIQKRLFTYGAIISKVYVNVKITGGLTDFDVQLYAVNQSFQIKKVGSIVNIPISGTGVYTFNSTFEIPENCYLAFAVETGVTIGYSGSAPITGGFYYKYGANFFNLELDSIVSLPQSITSSCAIGYDALQNTGSNKENSKLVTNYLVGKKLVVGGDSMVKGHTLADYQTWLSKLANRNLMVYDNQGINGNRLTDTGGTGECLATRFSTFDSNADYVLIFIGTNDAQNSVSIGTDTDTGVATFKGALNTLCAGLLNKYPSKKIGFITPYQRKNGSIPDHIPYIEAIKTICKLYSIPVFDNYTNGGVYWTNTAQLSALVLPSDTYHLNETGMEYASYKYEHFLRSL